LLKPETVASEQDDLGMVDEPVDHCRDGDQIP
jgi:hypothetical protein